MARGRFRGKEAITVLLVLPIALPGILTGIALLAAMKSARIDPGFWTIVAGHATFCIVIVYNNVVARLRRMPQSWIEASMDLGADGWQTFRYVVLPQIATALLAAACWRSRCRSTRSSSRCSPRGTSGRCRSGSSTSCSGRASGRSPTWSRSW